MPTHAYIHFQGNCAEALEFYTKVFAGTDVQMMRYADGPGAPNAWKNSHRVMHGQVTLGDGTLMASDYPPGTEGMPQQGFSIMHAAPTVSNARAVFEQLAEGGRVIDGFRETFFSPGFGMVEDRFGTQWIISTTPAKAA